MGAKRKCQLYAFLMLLIILLCAPSINADYLDPFTYQDTVTFNSTFLYTGQASWWHAIPSDFTPISAEISLTLKVVQYSDIGVLDLFSSNTNVFDYGSPYTAPSKPGYIINLYHFVPPTFVNPNWQTVSFSLKNNQVDWLDDDGNINLALIGAQYIFPTGFPARFYVQSATLTASAIPIPGSVWLLASGLISVFALRKKFL
jgi:hypothetical protein